MKNISLRTEEKIANELAAIYENTSKGAAIAVEAFPYMRKYTLDELRGIFTKEELSAIVNSLNSIIMQAELMISKDVFVAHLEDSDKFEGLAEIWGIDFVKLSEKIERLSSVQVYFLQDEIRRFWDIPAAYGSPNSDFDKFVGFFDRK